MLVRLSVHDSFKNGNHIHLPDFSLSERTTPVSACLRTGFIPTKDPNVRYFRNPCDRDPPTENFKNFKFFKNSLKILERLLFEKERLLLGNERLLLGNERLLLGIIGGFGFFGTSFFLLLGSKMGQMAS